MIIRVNPIGIFLLNTPLNRIFEYYRYDYTNFLPLDSFIVRGGVKLGCNGLCHCIMALPIRRVSCFRPAGSEGRFSFCQGSRPCVFHENGEKRDKPIVQT